MGTAASHSLQLRGGNEHSQRTGTAHPGRHRQHRKTRVRELHDRRQARCLNRKKRMSSQLFKCCKNTRHGAGGGTLRSNRPLLALRAARPAGQNAPQDRFVSPASSPVRLNQTQRYPTGASVFGAGGGTRTHTVLLPTDFESVTSANSITPANMFKFCTYISLTHFLNGFKRENHIILKI